MSDMYNNPVQRGFFPDPSVVRVGDDYIWLIQHFSISLQLQSAIPRI